MAVGKCCASAGLPAMAWHGAIKLESTPLATPTKLRFKLLPVPRPVLFMVDCVMVQRALYTCGSSCRTRGVTPLILVLCICVVTQMLGAPVTLIGLLNEDVLTKSEPVSEDFSTLSTLPEPGQPRLLSLIIQFRSRSQLPILPVSVFRPPLA